MRYLEIITIYDRSDFDPNDVPEGMAWRRRAMRAWSSSKRKGLVPLVSDSVPDLGPGHCYSCAAKIRQGHDSGERKWVGHDKWCVDCQKALVTTLI